MIPYARLKQAEVEYFRQKRIMFILGFISLLVFFVELFVAFYPTFYPPLTLAAMMIAVVFGGTLSFFNLLYGSMPGPQREDRKTNWTIFFLWLDRRIFYIIFFISFAGFFLNDIKVWALWCNVVIPLRWLWSGLQAWLNTRRMNKRIQKELSCPEKIEINK